MHQYILCCNLINLKHKKEATISIASCSYKKTLKGNYESLLM